LLLRAGILVDANRDGQFSQADEGKITEEKPWRIWVNDDDDSGETGGSDISTTDYRFANYWSSFIDQERDLIDCFPATIQISVLLKMLPPTKNDYILRITDGPLYAPIAVSWLEDVSFDNHYGACNAYQKEIEVARKAAKLMARPIDHNGIYLPTTMTDKLSDGDGMMLIQGIEDAHTFSFTLEVYDKSSGYLVTDVKLPTAISRVEDMYRTVNLMYVTTDYNGTPRNRDSQGTFTRITEPPGYPDSETSEKYFVFVHGFNVSPKKTRGWNAEVFKRLHQLGSRARFVGITWDSDELLPNYHRAVFQAFQTGDALGGALSFAGGADVTIAAHSLGNMVVSHAIQDGGFLPTRYYAINAAVPREAYTMEGITDAEKRRMVESRWKDYWDYNPNNAAEQPLKHLFASNWHQLFPSDDNRSKLTWKNRFSSIRNRMYNFYSPGDDVVRDANPALDTAGVIATARSGNGFSSYSWAAQEYVKGGTSAALFAMLPYNSIQAGWSFNIHHMDFEMTGNAGRHVPRTPVGASLITASQLLAEPFMRKFNEYELHGTTIGVNSLGSIKAQEAKVKYDTLARGIPALSFAAATHSIDGAKENFNMEASHRTSVAEWPTEGHTSNIQPGRWLHSDLKNVAMIHVYKMYEQMINSGELDK
jgi:hypothetical protein